MSGSVAERRVLYPLAVRASYVTPPEGWTGEDARGVWTFVTRESFRAPDGSEVSWSSRAHRKQAGRFDAGRGSTWWAPSAMGWWIGVLFAIGALCFTIGPFPGFVDLVGTDADAIVFFVGSIFFTSAAFLQYLQTLNAPHALTSGAGDRFRFWTWEPGRIDWSASLVQFVGTLFFNVTTLAAMTPASTAPRPGVGWVIWRNPDPLPDDLVFNVNYLGGDMPTFALNFSRPGNQIAAQYYNFLRLGFEGYRRVQQASRDVARFLADAVGAMDHFELITDGSELPVFAFSLKAGIDNYTVFDLSERLRDRGWLIPAYSFPENRQDLDALRVVVRNGFSRDLADLLVADLQRHTAYFDQLTSPLPGAGKGSFSH